MVVPERGTQYQRTLSPIPLIGRRRNICHLVSPGHVPDTGEDGTDKQRSGFWNDERVEV
jgi:hypothetical protein